MQFVELLHAFLMFWKQECFLPTHVIKMSPTIANLFIFLKILKTNSSVYIRNILKIPNVHNDINWTIQ